MTGYDALCVAVCHVWCRDGKDSAICDCSGALYGLCNIVYQNDCGLKSLLEFFVCDCMSCFRAKAKLTHDSRRS